MVEFSISEERPRSKKRSLAGNLALCFYILALLLVFIAFFSTRWIVSDERLKGSKLRSFGLWTHCFRSLPDPSDPAEQRVFVGCHWIFDPFTDGYSNIRHFLLPLHIKVTQFFYSVTFIGTLVSAVGSSMFLFCSSPEEKRYEKITLLLGITLIVSGICAGIAVLIFALFANQPNWMPGHDNNYFGRAFGVAIASFITLILSGAFYLVETHVQKRRKMDVKQSQTISDMETET